MENTKEITKTELDIFVQEKNLATNFPNYKVFEEFLIQAREWTEKGMSLKITGIEQTTEMAQAREGRLFLRGVRINIENKRKSLKEESLRTGQAIDTVAKFLISAIEPTEEHLNEQEKFIERLQEAKKQEIKSEREEKLKPYILDFGFFDLLNMPEENFQNLLENSRLAYETRIENDRKIEEERIRSEKINIRINELYSLGFIFVDAITGYKSKWDIPVSRQLLENCPDLDWNETIKSVKENNTLNEANEKIEKQRLLEENKKQAEKLAEVAQRQKIGNDRVKSLSDIGMTVHFDEVSEINEEAFREIYAERKKRKEIHDEQKRLEYKALENKSKELAEKKEKEEKAEADRIAKEEAELALGDKGKFISIIQTLEELKIKFEFKSKKSQKLSSQVNELLTKTVNFINEKI